MEDGPGDLTSIKGEMPIGLGMRLMQDRIAMDRFTSLSDMEKKGILTYVESGATGDEAEERVARTVKSLHDGMTNFYLVPPPSTPIQKRPPTV